MTERTGRCLCGAVSFKLDAEPLATRVCWCRDCQHLAANGSVNLLVSTDALSIVGVLAEHTQKADSGNEVTRQFCPNCGSHLFAKSSARPQFRVVRAGNAVITSSTCTLLQNERKRYNFYSCSFSNSMKIKANLI